MPSFEKNKELFKSQIKNGKQQLGIFVKIYSLELIEIIGLSGFDFIVIDMEHTTLTFDKVENMVRTADLYKMDTIIRIPDSSPSTILHALDLGATGIQVPQVDTMEEIRGICLSAKYTPEGTRGVTYAHRSARFGFRSGREYMLEANEKTVVVIHIETEKAFNQLESITAVEGIDVVFIGPVDLSMSLGMTPDFIDGEFRSTVETIIHSCNKNGKCAGIMVNTEKEYKFALEYQIPYIIWGSDVSIFKQGVTNIKRLQEKTLA